MLSHGTEFNDSSKECDSVLLPRLWSPVQWAAGINDNSGRWEISLKTE